MKDDFILKFHRMIIAYNDPSVIRFSAIDTIEYSKTRVFEALEADFDYTDLPAFQRQLSYYGFKRISDSRKAEERGRDEVIFRQPSGFFRSDDLTSSLVHNVKRLKRNRGSTTSKPATCRTRTNDGDSEGESELSSLSDSEDTKSTSTASKLVNVRKRPRAAVSPTGNPKPSKISRKVGDQSVTTVPNSIVSALEDKGKVEVAADDTEEEEEQDEDNDDDDATESYAPTLKERKKLNTPPKKGRGSSKPSATFKRKGSRRLEGGDDDTAPGTSRPAEFPPTAFSYPSALKKKELEPLNQGITEDNSQRKRRSRSLSYSDYSSVFSSDEDEDEDEEHSMTSMSSTHSSRRSASIPHYKTNDLQPAPFASPPRSVPSATPQGTPPGTFEYEMYRYRTSSPMLISNWLFNDEAQSFMLRTPPSPFKVATGFFQTTLGFDLGKAIGINPRDVEPSPIFI